MNDEKKTYSVVGTVTIGADEYRDLIEEVVQAKAEADRWRHDYYSTSSENSKLKEAVNTQISNAQVLRDFVYADDERTSAYKVYLAEKYAKENE